MSDCGGFDCGGVCGTGRLLGIWTLYMLFTGANSSADMWDAGRDCCSECCFGRIV